MRKLLKCFRTYNKCEYTSHKLKNYYPKHGIQHEKIIIGIPQHNGVVVRMNRTIVESM